MSYAALITHTCSSIFLWGWSLKKTTFVVFLFQVIENCKSPLSEKTDINLCAVVPLCCAWLQHPTSSSCNKIRAATQHAWEAHQTLVSHTPEATQNFSSGGLPIFPQGTRHSLLKQRNNLLTVILTSYQQIHYSFNISGVVFQNKTSHKRMCAKNHLLLKI